MEEAKIPEEKHFTQPPPWLVINMLFCNRYTWTIQLIHMTTWQSEGLETQHNTT